MPRSSEADNPHIAAANLSALLHSLGSKVRPKQKRGKEGVKWITVNGKKYQVMVFESIQEAWEREYRRREREQRKKKRKK